MPPTVLEFFQALRALADDAINQLSAAATAGAAIERNLTDSAGMTDSRDVVLEPATLHLAAQVVVPNIITAERFEEARVWTELAAAAHGALPPFVVTAEALAVFESLLQLAQRLLGIG